MEIIARPERIEATAIKCDRYDGEVWDIAAVKFTLQDPNTPEDEPCRHGHEVFVPLGGRLREDAEDRGLAQETMEALNNARYLMCQPNGIQMDSEIEEDPCEMDHAVPHKRVHYSPYQIVDTFQTTDDIGKLMNMKAGDRFTIQAHQKLYPAHMPWTQVDGIEITVPHEQKKRKRDAGDE